MCRTCTNAINRARRRKAPPRVSRANTGKLPPCIRVVEDKYGNRRMLKYWEHEPKSNEVFVGVGYHLLKR
jgi:hypothetical protein